MEHIYEFEVFPAEGAYCIFPFDWPGATEGLDMHDVAVMAVDWLRLNIEMCAIDGRELPQPTFGNKPRYGGTIMLVAVDAGIETIPRVTPADAARALGVTPARVSQLMASGRLDSFEYEGRKWVSRYSLDARLEEAPKPGRPKRKQVSGVDAPVCDPKPSPDSDAALG